MLIFLRQRRFIQATIDKQCRRDERDWAAATFRYLDLKTFRSCLQGLCGSAMEEGETVWCRCRDRCWLLRSQKLWLWTLSRPWCRSTCGDVIPAQVNGRGFFDFGIGWESTKRAVTDRTVTRRSSS